MIKTTESPMEAASRLAATMIRQGYKLEGLYPYHNENGEVIYYRIRYKHPKSKKKWIRPMYKTGTDYKLGEPKMENGKPLYDLHSLNSNKDNEIWICEGENCVDALKKFGISATTSGAANTAKQADWSPLSNKSIIIWPDNDQSGTKYASDAAKQLHQLGCEIYLIDINSLKLPEKGDVIDWLERNPNAKKDNILNLKKNKYKNHTCKSGKSKNEKVTLSKLLLEFAKDRVELFHDDDSEAYARIKKTREIILIESPLFRDWLTSSFYEHSKIIPHENAIRETRSTMIGLAKYTGKCEAVYTRVANKDDSYYLDLAIPGKNKAVCIKPGKWEISDNPPVNFIRNKSMKALPVPIPSSQLKDLWDLINIPARDQLLVTVWLLDCLRPETPFPILELIGQQGSAKSTTQKILRKVIDPNKCNLRGAPKCSEDIYVSAAKNWIVSFENISHLSALMQDTLCITATGGGMVKRKLYSDTEECIINVKRPVIINGINASITAQDLVDRTLSIEMPNISKRLESFKIDNVFENKHPEILGAILDIFAKSLSILPTIEIPPKDCPRLVEFTLLGMAASKALGKSKEEFLAHFKENRKELICRTIESSPVACALLEWIGAENFNEEILPVKILMAKVEMKKSHRCDNWPKSPKGFADALRRVAPALKQIGIECECLGKQGGLVHWKIKRIRD